MPLNLSINDVYNAEATAFYKLSFEIVTCCQLILLPFLIYIIFTQSSKMRAYSWYILNTIFWNTAMEILTCLICPVILSPYALVFFAGPLNFLDVGSLRYFFELIIFCAGNMAFSICVSVFYRLTVLLNVERLMGFFDNPKSVIIWHVMGQVLTFCFVYFCFEIRRDAVLQSAQYAIEEDAFLGPFYQIHPFIGFIIRNDPSVLIYIVGVIFLCIAFILLAIIGTAIPFVYMKKIKNVLSAQTYKSLLMLFGASLIQMYLVVIFLICPLFGVVFITYFSIPYTSVIEHLLLGLVSFHSLMDSISIICFIRAYREYVVSVFLKLIGRKLSNTQLEHTPNIMFIKNDVFLQAPARSTNLHNSANVNFE